MSCPTSFLDEEDRAMPLSLALLEKLDQLAEKLHQHLVSKATKRATGKWNATDIAYLVVTEVAGHG